MKEIGGYLELDNYDLPMLHDDLLKFNCARNCLAYLIETKKIKKIFVPSFLCDSVFEVLNKYDIQVEYYGVGMDFYPENVNSNEDYIYIVNYYGQIDPKIIAKKYKKVIFDNTQSYYDEPYKDFDTIYSCRKYFGVPDGALLKTDATQKYDELDISYSYDRMIHLLGRYEKSGSEFYKNFAQNDEKFKDSEILKMSKLTNNLLHGINYDNVLARRNENLNYLYNNLNLINKLNYKKVNGAYAYPLYVDNAEIIRKKLIEKKIYIPILWGNVLELSSDSNSYKLANNILPIPCDQRYTISDMEYMCNIILNEVKKYENN